MSFSPEFASHTATFVTPASSFSELSFEPALPPAPKAQPDPFNLQRYIEAQDKNGIFNRVIEAIRNGGKIPLPVNAWIWCVFPQMDHCRTRRRFGSIFRSDRDVWPKGRALVSLDEARAILKHPVLGPRMKTVAQALLDTRHADIFCALDHIILDVQRVHSTMTIFREASRRPLCLHEIVLHGGTHGEFRMVLDKHFSHGPDSDDEMSWGEPIRPIRKLSSRHKPTMQQLEVKIMEVIEQRIASKDNRCVCAREKCELDRLEEEFMEKVRDKRKKRLQREPLRVYAPHFVYHLTC